MIGAPPTPPDRVEAITSAGPVRRAVMVLGVALVAACTRAPLEVPCPDLRAGDLVISELRGEQSGTDTRGQWVELYNASGLGEEPIDSLPESFWEP